MYCCVACLGCTDVPGCVHVCLHFAVDVGSSGVCMFPVLILTFILVLNCEVLLTSLLGLGAIKVLRIIIIIIIDGISF